MDDLTLSQTLKKFKSFYLESDFFGLVWKKKDPFELPIPIPPRENK